MNLTRRMVFALCDAESSANGMGLERADGGWKVNDPKASTETHKTRVVMPLIKAGYLALLAGEKRVVITTAGEQTLQGWREEFGA